MSQSAKKDGEEETARPVDFQSFAQTLVLSLILGLVIGLKLDSLPPPDGSLRQAAVVAAAALMLEIVGGSLLHLIIMWKAGDFAAIKSQDPKLWYYRKEMDFCLIIVYAVLALTTGGLTKGILSLNSAGSLQTGLLIGLALAAGVVTFTLLANRPETKNRL